MSKESAALYGSAAPPSAEPNRAEPATPIGVPGFRLPWRRLGLIAAVVVLGDIAFVFLVRRSQRILQAVASTVDVIPQLFFFGALVSAALWHVVPMRARHRLSEWGRSAVATTLLLITCVGLSISPALVSWMQARFSYSKIGGVIPWSDAHDYLVGGLNLLEQSKLDAFNMRRPLNAGFIAVRMAVARGDFWAVLLMQGVVVGLAGLLVVKVVSRRLGFFAGMLLAGALFAFIHPLIDTTLSEALGLAMGCIGFSALIQGVDDDRPFVFALGVLGLTLALNARSGAYFVLPALLVWLAFDRRLHGLSVWRPLTVSAAALLAGFLLVAPLNALYGTGSASMNGNFAYTLYGVTHGGIGWSAAYDEFRSDDYPNEQARTSAVYRAALSEVRHHPTHLLKGIWNGYRTYSRAGVFGFAPSPVSGGLTILTVPGFVLLLRPGPMRRLGTLVAACWVGILLSVPFVFGDGGARVMAVVIPILAVPPAAGLLAVALIARRFVARRQSADIDVQGCDSLGIPRAVDWETHLIGGVSLTAVAVLVIGPHIAVALDRSPPVTAPVCAGGDVPIVGWLGPQIAHVSILPASDVPGNFGETTLASFNSDPDYGGNEMAAALASIPEGSVLAAVNNLLPPSQGAFVVIPIADYPRSRRLASFCGHPSQVPVGARYGLLSVTALKAEHG